MAAMLLCAAISGSAQAAPPGISPTVYGFGLFPCTAWLHSRDASSTGYTYSMWVLGWVSAAGYYSGQRLREFDAGHLDDRMDSYCGDHPRNPIRDGAASLVDELSKTK